MAVSRVHVLYVYYKHFSLHNTCIITRMCKHNPSKFVPAYDRVRSTGTDKTIKELAPSVRTWLTQQAFPGAVPPLGHQVCLNLN